MSVDHTDKDLTVNSTFTAWASPLDPDQSPLIARGMIRDKIVINDGYPRIRHRTFAIERVMQPNWLVPTFRPPFPVCPTRKVCTSKFFLAYQHAAARIRWLRKYKKLVTPLVAISALVASIQDIVQLFDTKVSLFFSAVGIASASLGVALLLLDRLVEITDESARRRTLEMFNSGDE